MPAQPSSTDAAFSGVSLDESTQRISTITSLAVPAWNSDSSTDRYASCSSVYLPTSAMVTWRLAVLMRVTICVQAVSSGSPHESSSFRHTTRASPSFSSSSGTS